MFLIKYSILLKYMLIAVQMRSAYICAQLTGSADQELQLQVRCACTYVYMHAEIYSYCVSFFFLAGCAHGSWLDAFRSDHRSDIPCEASNFLGKAILTTASWELFQLDCCCKALMGFFKGHPSRSCISSFIPTPFHWILHSTVYYSS